MKGERSDAWCVGARFIAPVGRGGANARTPHSPATSATTVTSVVLPQGGRIIPQNGREFSHNTPLATAFVGTPVAILCSRLTCSLSERAAPVVLLGTPGAHAHAAQQRASAMHLWLCAPLPTTAGWWQGHETLPSARARTGSGTRCLLRGMTGRPPTLY